MTALALDRVSKIYPAPGGDVTALDDVTLTVDDGEIVALVGPSGSGKSTLLTVAGALLAPTQGTVRVGGHDITALNPRQRTAFRRDHVGFVFQTVNLVPYLTAEENLLVVADLAGMGKSAGRERARRLLDELALTDRRHALPAQLSGGERQRVAVGRALMNDPTIVLVDEPTSALDTALAEQVMELVRAELRERDVPAVIVTHDPRVTRYADRTLHLRDGRIVEAEPAP
ncbi:MAG TPA: ABC transporter ATP-binding protein [Acidimicrobiales bacterium]